LEISQAIKWEWLLFNKSSIPFRKHYMLKTKGAPTQ